MADFERVVVPHGEPLCPAGALVSEAAQGTGCVCRVTHDLISSRRNPSTLRRYCFNTPGYQQCPTWRADREETLRSGVIKDLLTPEGDLTAGHPEDREREQGLADAIEAQEREAWETQRQRNR